MKNKGWTFVSNHGRVFAYIATHCDDTAQEIAQQTRLSIRAVQKIICDLEREGYLSHQKVGRNNHYKIHSEMPIIGDLECCHYMGKLLFAGLSSSNTQLKETNQNAGNP